MNNSDARYVSPWGALEMDRMLRLGLRLCANPNCSNVTDGDDLCAIHRDEINESVRDYVPAGTMLNAVGFVALVGLFVIMGYCLLAR